MQTNNQNQQTPPPQTKALAPIQQVQNLVYAQEDQFNQLSSQYNAMIKFKTEAHFAMQAMQKNEFLMTTAIRNPQSLKNAILNVASIGLSLNPAERQSYLVPRDGQVCLDISYIGLADLATQSGSVKWVQAKLVHANDEYQFQGIGKEPLHKYKSFSDRGPVIGVYCVALTHDGQYLSGEMSLEECHKIRNRTDFWRKKPNTGPWATDEGEMMKKTVVKRESKLWPKATKDTRLFKAIDVVNQHEGINFDEEREELVQQKEALRIAAREKMAADREEHQTLVDVTIKCLAADLTTGMTAQDKGKFMREHLGVTSYDHLNRLSNDELKALAEKLTAMKQPGEQNDNAGTDTSMQ
jgi:recombination protein RecT